MRLVVPSFLLTVLALAPVWAQDPVKTLPDSYRLDLENDWVRVVHVRYAAHAQLPLHDHPKVPAATNQETSPAEFLLFEFKGPR